MNNKVINILKKAYTELGNETFCDNRKLLSLLSDLIPEFANERKRLSLAINEGIVKKVIVEHSEDEEQRAYLYLNLLIESYGIQQDIAEDIIYAIYQIVKKDYHISSIGILNQDNEGNLTDEDCQLPEIDTELVQNMDSLSDDELIKKYEENKKYELLYRQEIKKRQLKYVLDYDVADTNLQNNLETQQNNEIIMKLKECSEWIDG